MSSGQIALNRIGVKPDIYYAAEIDKYAITVTQKNYPDTIQLGSILGWGNWNLDWKSIDIVTGGFPCQSWSVAGKGLGDKDPRGALFWTFLDIIKNVMVHNPNAKFLMENVKMKKEFEQYITHHTEQALGTVHKTLINSALVSAQSRQRYYWTNFEVTQPEDKGIILADILEIEVSDVFITPTPANHNGGNQLNPEYKSQANTIHAVDSKSPTICAGTHGYALGYIPICSAKMGLVGYDDYRYRKLTPVECERLQTVPDNFTECVSNTQRYKMLGNGWTVDVIAHILKDGLKQWLR
jgi:DNA (cytosine-5)-methyltransferase 1/DNA (cytosine-5)-methyltransferase 3A